MDDDTKHPCGHRTSERKKAMEGFPSSMCPACLADQDAAKDKALTSIWYFIKDDFPRGTGTDHGTCATEPYRMAARLVEQCVKGGA